MKQKLALISGILAITLILPFLSPFIFNAEENLGDRHKEFEEALSVRNAVYLTSDNIKTDGYLKTRDNILSVTKEVYSQESVTDAVYDGDVTDYVYDRYDGYGIPYYLFSNKDFNNDTEFQFKVSERGVDTNKLVASFSPDFVSPDYSLLLTYKEIGPYPGSAEEIKEINGVAVKQLSPQLEYFADMYYAYDDTESTTNSVGVSELKTMLPFGLKRMPTLVYKVDDGENTQYIEDFETELDYYKDSDGAIYFDTDKNDVTFLFVDNDEPVSRFDHFTKKIYDKYYKDMNQVTVNQLSPVLFDSQDVINDLLDKESKLESSKDPLIFSENNATLSVPGSLLDDELGRNVNFDATLYNSSNSSVTDPLETALNIDILYQNPDESTQEDRLTRYENPLTYSITLDETVGDLLDEDEKIYLLRSYPYTADDGGAVTKYEHHYVNHYETTHQELKASIYLPGEYKFVKVKKGEVTPINGSEGFVKEEPVDPEEPEDPNENPDDPTDSEDPDNPVTPVEPDPSAYLVIDNENFDTYKVTNGDLYTYNKNYVIIMGEVLRQLQSGDDFKAEHDGIIVRIPKDIVTNQHFYGDQFNYRVTPQTDTSDFNAFRLRSNAYDFRLSNSESLYLSEFPTLSKVSMAFDVDTNRINNPEGLKYATIGRNGDIYVDEISNYMQSTGTVYIEPKQTGKYVIIEEIVEEPNDNTNDDEDTDDDSNNDDTDDDTNNDTDDEEENVDDDQDEYDYPTNAVVIQDINLSKYQAGNKNLYTDDINNVYVSDDVLDQLTGDETLTTTHDDGKLEVEFPNALLTDDFFENKRFNFTLKEEPNQAGFEVFDLKSQIYHLNILNGDLYYREKFPEKVTMTFEVNPKAIDDPDGLRFIRLSEDGNTSINPISSYNETRGEVVIETDTFSFYAIAEVQVTSEVVPNEDEEDQTDDTPGSDDSTTDDSNNEDESSNNNDPSNDDNTSTDGSDETTDNDENQTGSSNNDSSSNGNSTNTGTNNNEDDSTNTGGSNSNDSNSTGSVAGANDENNTNDEATNNPNSALPNTATLMYSLMAFGLLLIVSSSLLYLISSKKKKQ